MSTLHPALRPRKSAAELGSTRASAIVLPESQESTGSDSSTPSSHLNDSQPSDEEYVPGTDTQPIGSQGPAVQEEVADLLHDPHTVDTDMLRHEQAQSLKAGPSMVEDLSEYEDLVDYEDDAPVPSAPATVPSHRASREIAQDTEAHILEDQDASMEDSTSSQAADAADNSFSSAGSDIPAYKCVVVGTCVREDSKIPLTFAEVRTLIDKNNQSVASNSAIYIISGRNFDTENPDHHAKLTADTEKHGRTKGFRCAIVVNVHPATGRNKVVDVIWTDIADYNSAKRMDFKIYWKGIGVKAKSWGPSLPCRSRAIKVHLPPGQTADTYATAFERACANHHLSHLWTIGTQPADRSQDIHPTGVVVGVVSLQHDSINTGKSMSDQDLANLPNWVLYAGNWYETHYAGRALWCRHCRGKPDFPLHLTDLCPIPWCKPCRKHHLQGECHASGARRDRLGNQHQHPQHVLPPRSIVYSTSANAAPTLREPIVLKTDEAAGPSSFASSSADHMAPPPSADATSSTGPPPTGSYGVLAEDSQ
ncbi:hypothetical protein CF326_g9068 [Tilletia indica]|nr:hypothetical protein CF326_g9068 [Tilletia indica]